MPYIPKEDRPLYNEQVKKVLEAIQPGVSACWDSGVAVDVVVTGEHVAFFVHDVVKRFMGNYDGPHSAFNSLFFDKNRKAILEKAAADVADLLSSSGDLVKQAGELNYVLSAVVWGVLGENGKYAMRAFIKGAIHHIIKKEIEGCGDMRRYLMVYGVLTDVIDETYRRKTAGYEDSKMEQNGDIWPIIEQHALTPEEVARHEIGEIA